MILGRAFRPGDRLPSVRDLSRQEGVSVTTVIEAYRLLEAQGLIHPRPQSGYFVHAYASSVPAEPTRTEPAAVPSEFRLEELLQEMGKHNADPAVVKLAFATPNPSLLPHAKLARIMTSVVKDHPEASYGYGPSSGHRQLREQIAQRAFGAGAVVSPDEIVITTGCQEALYLALRAACPDGGVVLVESPCHYGVLQAIQLAGLRSMEVCTRPREGICVDAVEEAIQQGLEDGVPVRACLVNPNFHNPLGGLLSDRDKMRLIEVAERYGVTLIEDDVYGDLGHEIERPRVAKSYDEQGNVLLCSSFSKTISPGYRIGWIIAGKRHAQLERLKHALSYGAAGIPQLTLAEFLSTGGYDVYLRRARKAYAQNVARVSTAIARYFPAETKVTRPAGGFVLWVEMAPRIDSVKLYTEAVKHGVLIGPGTLFSGQGNYRNFFRMNAAQWNEETEAAIARLGKLVQGM
jgi:DNA-binding transcriptional MocR family regulator